MKKDIKLTSLMLGLLMGGALFAGQSKECKKGTCTDEGTVVTEPVPAETATCEGDDCEQPTACEKGK